MTHSAGADLPIQESRWDPVNFRKFDVQVNAGDLFAPVYWDSRRIDYTIAACNTAVDIYDYPLGLDAFNQDAFIEIVHSIEDGSFLPIPYGVSIFIVKNSSSIKYYLGACGVKYSYESKLQ